MDQQQRTPSEPDDFSYKAASGVPSFSFLEVAYTSWLEEIRDGLVHEKSRQSPQLQKVDACVCHQLPGAFFTSHAVSAEMLRKGILIFGHETLASALSVLENNRIVCMRGSSSSRLVYAVDGRGSSRNLAVLLDPRYCPCNAYFTKYLSEQQQFLCDHIVAVEIGKALGLVNEQEVPDRDVAFKLTTSLQI